MSVHQFAARDINGQERSLADYAGKILLIVNTASACGLTPQYAGLEALQKRFADDLVVLGFPCNQFGGQEPGSEEEIASFCDLNFKVSFPMFAKVEVKGANAHPLYQYLTKELPGLLGTEGIKWNFTKFLVGRDGVPINRYAPIKKPEDIADEIETLIRG